MDQPEIAPLPRHRRGLALGLVLLAGIVVLVLGIAMISTSGSQLLGSVDAKQKIKARVAAETQANLQIADAVEKAGLLFGRSVSLPGIAMGDLHTGDGLKAGTTVDVLSGGMQQDSIGTGPFSGMRGYKQAFRIHSTGVAPGGAKSRIDVELKIYQIPIFQFGVFYEGNLEICPGSAMTVWGKVHTNGSAFFRAPSSDPKPLVFQGPITVVGSLYHWKGWGNAAIQYRSDPNLPSSLVSFPSLGADVDLAAPGTLPNPNVQSGVGRINLPIGGASPRDLILPKHDTDSDVLRKQKFDWLVKKSGRWLNDGSPNPSKPAWITGPRVFFDRREQAWVKYWDFDVSKIAANDTTSLFYLADTFKMQVDSGLTRKPVINAFRIVNAATLPRNMSIVTPNSIYLLGDFNRGNAGSHCRDVSIPSSVDVPDSMKYCNAMIASDAFTILSQNWAAASSQAGTMDQDFHNPHWTTVAEPVCGAPSSYSGAMYLNAAILTGNKPSQPAAWPVAPSITVTNGTFESNYEGGWHNTIRFLEELWPQPGQATLFFKGSFICMWAADGYGLNKAPNFKVIRPLVYSSSSAGRVATSGYYNPPIRSWGFDPRFSDLANMPPAAPFLTTPPTVSWSEPK